MALRSRKNQYRGVNTHLHSILQVPGTEDAPSPWRGFHNHMVSELMVALNEHLPEPYVAVNEQSLQILGDSDGGVPVRRKPIPDVSIYRRTPAQSSQQSGAASADAVLQFTVTETLAPDNTTDAVLIYRQGEHGLWGAVVTRIELLSPSNKHGGSNADSYSEKRSAALRAGVPLIEIDYLHTSPSPIITVPEYPTAPDAYPYAIAISDPRIEPNGQVQIGVFRVDSPIPTLPIPLSGSEQLPFDFGIAYQRVYERGPWNRLVDYAEPPLNIDSYSAADRERIAARMNAVRAAAARGDDLESGPFPLLDES